MACYGAFETSVLTNLNLSKASLNLEQGVQSQMARSFGVLSQNGPVKMKLKEYLHISNWDQFCIRILSKSGHVFFQQNVLFKPLAASRPTQTPPRLSSFFVKDWGSVFVMYCL